MIANLSIRAVGRSENRRNDDSQAMQLAREPSGNCK